MEDNKNKMEAIKTTTAKGTEGFNISYSDEMRFAKELLKVLPDGWSISIGWHQIMMSDVAFEIEFEKQLVKIGYNQNLTYWSKNLIEGITEKIKQHK